MKYNLITIVGPTASGKTDVAAHLAAKLDAEIISGDSRQVYRGMDIGTGKDLADYVVDGKQIPYHLIDIAEPGYKYNVYEFQRDFYKAFDDVCSRGKMPILCGGSGLYVESVLREYQMSDAPLNQPLRDKLEALPLETLVEMLKGYKNLHNTTDTDNKRRTIRAIEIAEYEKQNREKRANLPRIESLVVGISIDRDMRRDKISRRLRSRLDEGMVDEIKRIIDSGVSAEDLMYYGLEYKFVTQHVIGQLTYDEMVSQLETAIHQFAKRQMTWFRGMERRGVKIEWVDAASSMDEKVDRILELYNK